MYHTDRHTAYPEYCLSVSHSVSSLLPLILFIFFSPLHTIGVIPPKLPLFNAVFHLTAFPFTKLLPALISNILRSAGAHDYVP